MSKQGYRGYIASRPILGNRTPQHVQNLVIRDYAQRHQLAYRLSAAEYAMPHCYLMLEQVALELERLDGMIVYSLFMLPRRPERRRRLWRRLVETGSVFHAALEELWVKHDDDIERVETIFRLQTVVSEHGLNQDDLGYLRRQATIP